jgi:hypothetical protein
MGTFVFASTTSDGTGRGLQRLSVGASKTPFLLRNLRSGLHGFIAMRYPGLDRGSDHRRYLADLAIKDAITRSDEDKRAKLAAVVSRLRLLGEEKARDPL